MAVKQNSTIYYPQWAFTAALSLTSSSKLPDFGVSKQSVSNAFYVCRTQTICVVKNSIRMSTSAKLQNFSENTNNFERKMKFPMSIYV